MSWSVFESNVEEYDIWYEENKLVYKNELKILERFLKKNEVVLEIGAGTGRFTSLINPNIVVEPSFSMINKIEKPDLSKIMAVAENLPFKNEVFDSVFMIVTVCFLDNFELAMKEILRVLKPFGRLVIGFVDKDSSLGKKYEKLKEKNKYYKVANFYSTVELLDKLEKFNFKIGKIMQILSCDDLTQVEEEIPIYGFGKGSFVVVEAYKL